MSTKYPSVPEHELTPQGRINRRAVSTDEKLHEIAPEFRGTGATPQDKADDTRAWISKENGTREENEKEESSTARAQHDTYAQELNKRLGPVSFVMDSLQDGIEAAKESVSGNGKATAAADSGTDGKSQNSMAGTISQYTQAAWDKVNELKPTLGGGAKEPDAKESQLEGIKQQMTEVAGKAKEETANGSTKLLAAGGDDVMKVLSDGASTQEDPLKANLRVATESLS